LTKESLMGDRVLSDEQIEAWRTDGYVVVEGFLEPSVVAAVVEAAQANHVPSREEYDRLRSEGAPASTVCDSCRQERPITAGMAWNNTPPYAAAVLNDLPFLPQSIVVAEQLLGTPELRLTQSILRATYGGPETVDQALHRDYANNTLLTPTRQDRGFGQLAMILYLTDVAIGDAPTYVVGHRYGGDRPIVPSSLTKDEDPALYEHEFPVLAPAGSALFYTMRTWHRGSAGTDPKGFRLVHDAVYRIAGDDWMDYQAWASTMHTDAGQRTIERLTPRQRELIGIPPPGHPYWIDATVDDFAARYPGADAEPYRAAIA
jgi:ectoine hydroxylase-related dioxygenase (phytanoyl-CoA dioxygenase family)